MSSVVFGDGHLGQAIADALVGRGERRPAVLGRPPGAEHVRASLIGADLAFEASRPEAVGLNIRTALAAGCRLFVIATTGWGDRREAIDALLREHGAVAVAASNFSLGVAAFLRIVDAATVLFARLDEFDPFILEWHRRGKADRPSGTALEIARRMLAIDDRRRAIAGDPSQPPAADELEVVAIRAGASPGMHLVGFDASGETIELRLTARDRSPYAAGALAAADWLRRRPRAAGIHPFDEILDDLFADADEASDKRQAVAGSAG